MFDRILFAAAALAGAILAAIVLAISLNVVLRNLAGAPIHGLLDLVEYGLLIVTFAGAPWVLSRNGHVVVDLVTGALPEQTAVTLARIVAVIGCLLSALVVYYALQAVLVSYGRGSMIRTAFVVPEWWVLSVMPTSFLLITVEFARQALNPPVRSTEKTGL
ncbi:TRAP-type C4-dicarboxylate transport system, small permease component [Roseivivax lentus]|uniref:TRAP transporter small permease protein n=1 Tax=Roseivivax lentus TaxID=633194 RepID=A0A1N7PU32_9RHOB|nr:TRAP transporter small permease [Roseivivax lentus]SIT14055.1 TRAP-type C4-dicarboxylate transport system, small permease component [Roseivivax lentus]